jgi:hypothetical protein
MVDGAWQAAGKGREKFVQWCQKGAYKAAAETLARDWERMVSFYQFPKEYWKRLRTTNPIESPFAALRLRILREKDSQAVQKSGERRGSNLQDAAGRAAVSQAKRPGTDEASFPGRPVPRCHCGQTRKLYQPPVRYNAFQSVEVKIIGRRSIIPGDGSAPIFSGFWASRHGVWQFP